jgi:hypothetical protein
VLSKPLGDIAETSQQEKPPPTTKAKSCVLVLIEKIEKLRMGKGSILLGGTESAPAPHVTLGTGRSGSK